MAAILNRAVTLLAVFAAASLVGRTQGQCSTIYQTVASTPTLSTLAAAVNAAGYSTLLNDPDLVATVFAPTDEAFADALELLDATAAELLADVPALQALLQYHVVPGVAALSTDLSDGLVLPTLLPRFNVTIDISAGGVRVEDEVGRNATVTAADVVACKAVAHVIDSVLLPVA